MNEQYAAQLLSTPAAAAMLAPTIRTTGRPLKWNWKDDGNSQWATYEVALPGGGMLTAHIMDCDGDATEARINDSTQGSQPIFSGTFEPNVSLGEILDAAVRGKTLPDAKSPEYYHLNRATAWIESHMHEEAKKRGLVLLVRNDK